MVRLGDLMKDVERVVLANIYIGQLPEGKQAIGQLQIRYDDPTVGQSLLSDPVAVSANVLKVYQPALNPMVQQHILALAKYRQTQLAETRLQQGDAPVPPLCYKRRLKLLCKWAIKVPQLCCKLLLLACSLVKI